MSIINQYSFVFIAVGGALALAILMWRLRRPHNALLRAAMLSIYGILVILILAGSRFPASNTLASNYGHVEQTIHNGRPTFVMLYSHFCVGCITSLPSARSLDDQLLEQGQNIDLLFLDVHSEVGRIAREELGYNYTPTYILYNAEAQEVLRQNTMPSIEDIITQLGERISRENNTSE